MILHRVEVDPVGPPRGTLVAVPGLAESAASLSDALHRWAAEGWRAIAIDPRGHGGSPRWTDEQLARHPGDVIVDDLRHDLDELAAEGPLVLFGHSAGGSAAAALAAGRADGVAALVLEDPFWRLPVTRLQDPEVAVTAAETLARQQATPLGELVAAQRAEQPQWPGDELLEWAAAKHAMDVRLVRHGDVIPSEGWPEILDGLRGRVPVLVLTGTHRIGITEEHQRLIEERGGRVVRFPGASHFVRRDRRDAFHTAVAEFLAPLG